MSNPFRKVRPGEKIQIPASLYNALLDLLNSRDNYLAKGPGGTGAGFITVRNETATDVPRFGVIGLGEPIILPTDNLTEFQQRLTSRGVEPVPGRPFAIAQEPIAAGAIGRCAVSGLTPVKLSIYDPDPEAQWAEPANQSVQSLRTYRGGSMRILWRETGNSGTKWGLVAYGPNPHPLVRVRLSANLPKDTGQLIDALLLTRGANGLYIVPTTYIVTIKVADLSGLGFSAPANTLATAELHFGVTINSQLYDVIGIITDVRC